MKGIGRREIFALASLVAAMVIAAQFLNPSASESKGAATAVHLGGPPETPTPTSPPPTPTPAPVQLARPASGWFVQFFEDGFTSPTDQSFVPALAFSFPRTPFNDYKEGKWSLQASAQFSVADGESQFQLRHAGEVSVTVDGNLVAEDSTTTPRILDVTFEHAAGQASIVIEARDTGSPFELTWVNH